MGSSQSSTVNVLNQVTNNIALNMVNRQVSEITSTSVNHNRFTISIGEKADVKGCNIDLTQKINASQTVKLMSKVKNTSDLQAQINGMLDSAVTQANSATNGFLSTAFNNQKSEQDIKNIISNNITTDILNETMNSIIDLLDNLNEGTLIIKGKYTCPEGKGIVINQEIVSQQIAQIYADVVTEAAMKVEAISKAVSDSEQKNTSKNAGVAELVSAIFSGWALIIVIVIVVIGLLLWGLSKMVSAEDIKDLASSQVPKAPVDFGSFSKNYLNKVVNQAKNMSQGMSKGLKEVVKEVHGAAGGLKDLVKEASGMASGLKDAAKQIHKEVKNVAYKQLNMGSML